MDISGETSALFVRKGGNLKLSVPGTPVATREQDGEDLFSKFSLLASDAALALVA